MRPNALCPDNQEFAGSTEKSVLHQRQPQPPLLVEQLPARHPPCTPPRFMVEHWNCEARHGGEDWEPSRPTLTLSRAQSRMRSSPCGGPEWSPTPSCPNITTPAVVARALLGKPRWTRHGALGFRRLGLATGSQSAAPQETRCAASGTAGVLATTIHETHWRGSFRRAFTNSKTKTCLGEMHVSRNNRPPSRKWTAEHNHLQPDKVTKNEIWCYNKEKSFSALSYDHVTCTRYHFYRKFLIKWFTRNACGCIA